MAYLVNPAPEGDIFGKPSVAFDMIGLGGKNLDAFLLTENLFGRVEFGFAADDLSLGSLPGAEKAVLTLLNERNVETQRQACTILQQIGTSDSLAPLQKLMTDADTSVSQAAADAVRAITQRQ